MQETLFRAFRRVDSWRGGASFRSWLLDHRQQPASRSGTKAKGTSWCRSRTVTSPESAIRTPIWPRAKPRTRVREGLAQSATAAARSLPPAGAGGDRVRGDRSGARHHPGCRPGALPPCCQAAEGAGSMSDCDWLSDRMPAVALGRAQWTPQEVRHLTLCGSCQREWNLVRAANRLGTAIAEALDPTALAGSVLARVEHERMIERRRRRTWTFGGSGCRGGCLGGASGPGRFLSRAAQVPPRRHWRRDSSRFPCRSSRACSRRSSIQCFRPWMNPAPGAPMVMTWSWATSISDELERVLDSWEG